MYWSRLLFSRRSARFAVSTVLAVVVLLGVMASPTDAAGQGRGEGAFSIEDVLGMTSTRAAGLGNARFAMHCRRM